jgi:hypothetical protein
MPEQNERSAEACPECGAHRLAMIDFPSVSGRYQVNNELLGMGEVKERTPPGIGCLACGAEWRDLDTFRKAKATR